MIQILNGPQQTNAEWVVFGLFTTALGAVAWWRAGRDEDAFRRQRGRKGAIFILVLFGGLTVWQVLTHPW